MTTTQQLVVNAFQDRAQAEQAVNELLQAGFDNSQIRFAEQGVPTGGMLERFKSLFTEQDVSTNKVYHDLVNMGTPPEDALAYQRQFAAGRTLVFVQGNGNFQEAVSILARYGGHGARPHFAQSEQDAGVQEPASEDVRMQDNRQQVRPQEGGAMQATEQTVSRKTYADLVSVLDHALQMEQSSATAAQDAQHSGNQELAHFFGQVYQNASLQASRAQQLLGRLIGGSSSVSNDQPEQNRSAAHVGGLHPDQDSPSQESHAPSS